MNPPEERIRLMEWSLQCFVFGLLSLLPGIGLAFGCISLSLFARVQRREDGSWNPAAPYLSWGSTLAGIGILQSMVVIGLGLEMIARSGVTQNLPAF